nr:PREDICTED: uncharacterized protein LOC109043152 [Bemisia tabaci]
MAKFLVRCKKRTPASPSEPSKPLVPESGKDVDLTEETQEKRPHSGPPPEVSRFSRILHLDHPIAELFSHSGSALNLLDFRPGAFLSKRFGGRKNRGNDLRRSNSFKFERFERKDNADSPGGYGSCTLQKQISLCDDYCLPVDFVNKRRPVSLGAHHFSSPDGERVEVIENYSDPRDSKAYLQPGEEASAKLYSSPDSKYSQPCEERLRALESAGGRKAEDGSSAAWAGTPYYYADIHKIRSSKTESARRQASLGKSVSLDTADDAWMPTREPRRTPAVSSGALPDSRRNTLYIPERASLEESLGSELASDEDLVAGCQAYDWDSPTRILDELDLDEMSQKRHVYETAFDSQVSRSDEDSEIQRVASSSFLQGTLGSRSSESLRRFRPIVSSESAEFFRPNVCRSLAKRRPIPTTAPKATIEDLNDDLDALGIDDRLQPQPQPQPQPSSSTTRETQTPPSTTPLPPKFHSLHSIATAQSSPSIRGDLSLSASCTNFKKDANAPGVPKPHSRSARRPFPSSTKVLEIKSRPELKYSSTESVTCSSSGGSLESIRSSTSEDNRSTTSTGSHMSSSISSNSSESAIQSSSSSYHCPITLSKFFHQQNKLHILSPISDKSSQEPSERSSEDNRVASQRNSPEDLLDVVEAEAGEILQKDTKSAKKRAPFKKNLPHLNFSQTLSLDSDSGGGGTNQNSDSGISIEYSKSKTGSEAHPDFLDLPFDMPKLRRKRLQMQQSLGVQDTSSSATSVDIKDLPFDMPKLKRRLRNSIPAQTMPSNNVSLASSCNSVQETDPKAFVSRTQLTLNFGTGVKKDPKSLDLNLKLGEINSTSLAGESFDVTLPLERQSWYHGSITRVEAENILRNAAEGSYLVRNSESSRLDYSLSLKSARGFMHMRIQRDKESNQFILGHFSNLFVNVPSMIHHYSLNRIPIRGAEHMRLLHPLPEQLL